MRACGFGATRKPLLLLLEVVLDVERVTALSTAAVARSFARVDEVVEVSGTVASEVSSGVAACGVDHKLNMWEQ